MRIWVSRPEPGAARTAARLTRLGHAPLVAPVLESRPTGARLPDGTFAGLLLTSAAALDTLGADAAARLAGIPVFAVGARTAEAAVRAGLGPVTAGPGDAAALARLIAGALPAGTRLLHLAGADRKPEPAATLAHAGYDLCVRVVYAAEPVAALPEPVAAALGGLAPALHAALHYSRRSAATALALARDAGRAEPFGAIRHYCLSEDVAVPLATAGIPIHFVPERPGEDDLLAGLD
ncbi:uroporphyrinogen-III synthase [Methylobacterium radiodurans]|uniref:Uroporphyrinogen III synthase n=1 Tax=Methylobacterium radiodurans TaxID=2202828 RepID=A0A2U8VQN7_9HYPH|nr:uroporphyrinogen-III synthase [Methylobacterium radiodurans]AWN35788.1 uroporphyrinogen III synthase [Methylobacterium radiodurans]